jgi:hypothetical protein
MSLHNSAPAQSRPSPGFKIKEEGNWILCLLTGRSSRGYILKDRTIGNWVIWASASVRSESAMNWPSSLPRSRVWSPLIPIINVDRHCRPVFFSPNDAPLDLGRYDKWQNILTLMAVVTGGRAPLLIFRPHVTHHLRAIQKSFGTGTQYVAKNRYKYPTLTPTNQNSYNTQNSSVVHYLLHSNNNIPRVSYRKHWTTFFSFLLYTLLLCFK